MKKNLLLFFIFISYNFAYSQAGGGPVQSCSSAIPEICNGALYPAATSGTATAPFGANLNCGFTAMSANASFYYFLSNTNGPLNINITPTDILGVPYPNINGSPDLDFKCWGPYNDLLTMCDNLSNAYQEDCSVAPATTQEVLQITNAVAGEYYVVMISNWAATGTSPDPCYIQFTSAGPNDAFGGPEPGDAGGSVGLSTPLLFCDTDPIINLIDELNGNPVTFGYWTYNGDTVNGTFNPAGGTDSIGTYTYTIPGTANCPSDEAYVVLDVFSASNISMTSPGIVCSNEDTITLTAIPPVGWSSQGEGVFTNNAGTIITEFIPTDPNNTIGLNNITYTYTPTGCSPIPVLTPILLNEAPTVLANDVIITNPSCFGYTDGTVVITASGGTPSYTYDWFGLDPMMLPAGTFYYEVFDANNCSFSSSVTLYNPLNTTSIVNEYSSSCFGANDGSASITMLGGVTPPGTISTLSYCSSNPNPSFAAQPQTIIEEVQLIGDNVNIMNNTAGLDDYYEDYTTTIYADITEGQIYTVNVTANDLFATTGNYAPEAINVYIDFNIDGDFLDAGEDLGVINIPWGTWVPGTVYPFNFIVPATGAYGPTRMRVVCMSNASAGASMGSCESPTGFNTPWFGGTEDYSIVLNAPSFSATYLWENGSTTDSISNIGPGTYYVIITDVETGCPIQDSAVITEPAEIMFNPTITDITCNTFTDGSITLNPSGGNGGAYTINWYGQNPLALGNGVYTITVADPATITSTNLVACTNDTIIIMSEPDYFSVDFTTSDSDGEICFNDPLTLDLDFNQGGIPPYTINYTVNAVPQLAGPINSNGLNSVTVSPSLGNNTYIITSIVDANGCINQNTINSQDIYVNPLPDINIDILPNPICAGDNATLLLSTPSGTPPYIVDYNADGTPNSENVGAGGTNIQVNPNTTTTYNLTYVIDSKGCESNLSDNVTLVVNEIPQASFTSPSETCDGDVIQLKFDCTAGSAPWIISYSVNGIPTSIPLTNAIDSIAISPSSQTIYTIDSITDNNNCKNNITQSLIINTNPLPEINLSGGGSICDDGSTVDVVFTINSGTPPYNLNYAAGLNSNFEPSIGNIHTIATKEAGIYTIQDLIDSKGCQATSITGSAYVNINPLPEASINLYPQPADITNPEITFIDLSTGHIDGIWNFDDGETEETNFNKITYTYSDTGTYQVSLTVETDSGCTDIAWQTVIISPVFTIYVPNAFTPNNDLYNDYFMPIIDGVSDYEFSIYHRSGQRIFRTNDFSNNYLSCITDESCSAAWDGKLQGGIEYASKGTYIYTIVLTDINGKLRTYEGAFTLIR